jgi:hypothetical protein
MEIRRGGDRTICAQDLRFNGFFLYTWEKEETSLQIQLTLSGVRTQKFNISVAKCHS